MLMNKFLIEDKEETVKTLDIIDISLYDLLVKKLDLQTEFLKSKFPARDFVFNLIHTINFITKERKYDSTILSTLYSIINIISSKSFKVSLFTLKILNKKTDTFLNNLTIPFLSDIPNTILYSNKEIINALASVNSLVAVPVLKTLQKDMWWLDLLTKDTKNIGVVGKIPFIKQEETKEYFLLARSDNFYGFDRSLLVLATSEPITYTWLKAAMHKLNVPLYSLVDSTAIYNGTVLHLIEISKVIHEKDDIFQLNESINGINIRVVDLIGGYFLPLEDKDKILPFTSLSK